MTAWHFLAALYGAHVYMVAGRDAALLAVVSLLALGALVARAAHVYLGSVAEARAAAARPPHGAGGTFYPDSHPAAAHRPAAGTGGPR